MKQYKVIGAKILIFAEDMKSAKKMYKDLVIKSLFTTQPVTIDKDAIIEEICDNSFKTPSIIWITTDFIFIDGVKKKVVYSSEFTYKIMKTQVKVKNIDRLFDIFCDKFWMSDVYRFIDNFKK